MRVLFPPIALTVFSSNKLGLSPPAPAPPTPATAPPAPPAPALTDEEIERYSRHLILEDVGMRGQARLKAGSVCCVGAGGLGSPALMYLAAAGVGKLTIVDDDEVDVSNLQRQIVHASGAVGVSKAASAAETLQRVNPLVEVKQVRERLTEANADAILRGHDVVLDGCDNFPTKYLIDDACGRLGVPLVYAAILRFEGQASVFHHGPGCATYRDLLPEAPAAGAVPSCAEGGVLGVLPGVLGCIQATEALKIILGARPERTLANRLLVYDAMRMTFRERPLRKAAAPPAAAAAPAPAAGADDADAEAEICQLPFADALVPHRNVKAAAGDLPRDRDILVHCKSGFRSRQACADLAGLGFDRLFDMEGGILAWGRDVDPRLPK
ncbi:thiosulfate sulfurtransferase [Aureococcus anophagefferens]|nr:thiosulfate sulfurtransferase [Aureococcus anophagefferens]